jgi:hypothetical protein
VLNLEILLVRTGDCRCGKTVDLAMHVHEQWH